jgi:HK97 gp10 family phage protein
VKTRKDKNGDVGGSVEVGPAMNARRTDGKDSVGPGIYAMWVEFGLKRKLYPAQPFMRPTFDATAEKAVKLFSDTLKEALEEIAKE